MAMADVNSGTLPSPIRPKLAGFLYILNGCRLKFGVSPHVPAPTQMPGTSPDGCHAVLIHYNTQFRSFPWLKRHGVKLLARRGEANGRV